jgi:type III secretion system needle length determinant
MSKISGSRQPTGASSSEPGAQRGQRADDSADRDIQTEGRHLAHLLHHPPDHRDSANHQARQYSESPNRDEAPPPEDARRFPAPTSLRLKTRRQDHQQHASSISTFEDPDVQQVVPASNQQAHDHAQPLSEKSDSTSAAPEPVPASTSPSRPERSTIAGGFINEILAPQDADRSVSNPSDNLESQQHAELNDSRTHHAIPGNIAQAMGDRVLQGMLGGKDASKPTSPNPKNLDDAFRHRTGRTVDQPIPAMAHHPALKSTADQSSEPDARRDEDRQEASTDAVIRTGGDPLLQRMLDPQIPHPQNIHPSSDAISYHLTDLTHRLAERVLVSDRSENTDTAVRIQLRDSVLAGAEISIHRDQGQLMVSFHVTDPAVARQLQTHVGDLQRQLSDKVQQPVNIQVNISGNASDSGGDGRSRNRRDWISEWQDYE